MLRRWTAADDALLATVTPTEVSRRTGRSLNSIQKRRWKLKHRGASFPDYRHTAERLKAGRSVWTPEADDLVHRFRPIVVARLVGVTSASVQRRRAFLGLPPVGRKLLPPKPPPKYRLRKWSARELRIALSLPPRESVKRLPGRTISAIEAVRHQRKKAGLKVVKATKTGRPRKGQTTKADIHRHNGR